MFKQLPFKKIYLLIGGTMILLITCYLLAFEKTLAAWHLNSNLRHQLNQSADIATAPQYQGRKNANLKKIIDLYSADTIDFRSNILNKISSIAEQENVKLTEVPVRDPLYQNDHFIIQRLNFEGDYFSLIKITNQLQSTKDIGIIRAITLKKLIDPSNSQRLPKLVLEVYLEIKAGI